MERSVINQPDQTRATYCERGKWLVVQQSFELFETGSKNVEPASSGGKREKGLKSKKM